MMVRTLQQITTPRGEIPAGKIIEISERLAERLKGKVETVSEPATSADPLAIESDRRFDFCETHRLLIGGICHRHNQLDGCLLWSLVKAGKRIELTAGCEVVEGVIVGDVLQWVRHAEDINRIRHERRLLLTCYDTMRKERINESMARH